MRVAVIGAGLAGLAAARELHDAGHTVVVWEKSRGVGGRTATRRTKDGLRFDHGAPFLHDGGRPLEAIPGTAAHRLALPEGETREETVGVPTANAIAKVMATALDIRTGERVGSVLRAVAEYQLTDPDGNAMGSFDSVVVAAPAPQAAELLQDAAPPLASHAVSVAFAPCWAVMAAWDQPLDVGFSAAFDVPGFAHAIAERAKPGRATEERWVLALDTAMSYEHLESTPQDVVATALGRWFERVGPQERPSHVAAHRWLYSQPTTPLPETYLLEDRIAVVGDWCGGSTAGAALRSGRDGALALNSVPDRAA